jgi:hypothetical protein
MVQDPRVSRVWNSEGLTLWLVLDALDISALSGSTANTGFGGTQFTVLSGDLAVVPGDYFTVAVYQNSGAAIVVPGKFPIVALDGT